MSDLALEEVEYTSPLGVKLSMSNRITYPPAVFLNDKLIAKGKIDANTLIETIRGKMELTRRES